MVHNAPAAEAEAEPLVLRSLLLPPGREWRPRGVGWSVIHLAAGAGYWLGSRGHHELPAGSLVLLAPAVEGCVRASQVGELSLAYFHVEPSLLGGLAGLPDQAALLQAAQNPERAFRLWPLDSLPGQLWTGLQLQPAANRLAGRVRLLGVFLEALGDGLEAAEPPAEVHPEAGARLRDLLREMPAARLMEISFADLARLAGASPRHVSRLFTELVGVSFREKQTELRLGRACELLSRTDQKVVEVAAQSGYPSTSLFNLVFKQRFGVSPARWRQARRETKPVRRRAVRVV